MCAHTQTPLIASCQRSHVYIFQYFDTDMIEADASRCHYLIDGKSVKAELTEEALVTPLSYHAAIGIH